MLQYNTIRMFKSRVMRWVGNIACMGEKRNAYTEGKGPLG
jgi:hypothetical protein